MKRFVYSLFVLILVVTPQEAEQARNTLLELQSVAAAVESSGQAKAEAQVSNSQCLLIKFRLNV